MKNKTGRFLWTTTYLKKNKIKREQVGEKRSWIKPHRDANKLAKELNINDKITTKNEINNYILQL